MAARASSVGRWRTAVALALALTAGFARPALAEDRALPSREDIGALTDQILREAGSGDPLEPLNRLTDSFNNLVEEHALDPFYRFYTGKVPSEVRKGVSNVFRNLREPITAVSSALEGDLANAGVAGMRFALNSTVGGLGVLDVAEDFGLQSRRMDLGATLCRYGIPEGPYLVLPIIGPTSARDLVGRVTTNITIYSFAGALFYPYYGGKQLSEYVDQRPDVDLAMTGAVDAYARKRSIFRQSEAVLCRETLPETEAPTLGERPARPTPPARPRN
ncbi:MAG: VacJ family lipoprotein [Alphaproteobacteria bacterium]